MGEVRKRENIAKLIAKNLFYMKLKVLTKLLGSVRCTVELREI